MDSNIYGSWLAFFVLLLDLTVRQSLPLPCTASNSGRCGRSGHANCLLQNQKSTSTGLASKTVMSVAIIKGDGQSILTTKLTPWFGSYGGPCGAIFSTVIEAAPMNRCSALGGVDTAYSAAVMITTES